MKVTLSVYFNDQKKTSLDFTKREITIGRAIDCDLIVNEPSVSSKHFTIFNKKGRLFIRDEGSINGTFVNGKQVVEEEEIFPGDKITFCGYTIYISSDGESRRESSEEQNIGNSTVVIEKKDFFSDLKKTAKKQDKKKLVIYGSIGAAIFLLLIVLMLLPSSEKQTASPIRVGMVDSYFMQLEKHIDKIVTVKNSTENAERFLNLGEEQLKMANLNKEALFNALVYFLKAKKSVEEMNPKPPVWDKIIPQINKAKSELKLTLKKLFKDAWLLESDGNKEGAKDVYLAIMQTIPDENSEVYITALRRYNLLK